MLKKSLAVVALMTTSCLSVAKDKPDYQSWVGGFAEYYNADSDKPLNPGKLQDGPGLGLEFGYRFSPEWAARLEWSRLDIDTKDALSSSETGNRIGVDAMYFVKDDLFYLFGGVKNNSLGKSARMGNLGLGKHWEVSDNFRVITEAAVYHDFGQSYRDYGLKVGLAYVFGGSSTPSAPKDSDQDGVFDSIDQCPNTPSGTRVDAKGCDIDSDKDGVVNTLDMCPNTPIGTKVDATGCNADKDGDGVLNAQDKCPNTPAGTKVGAKGCSLQLDSDQDGVLDDVDQCADTPLSDKVDAVGCSIFEEKQVTVNLKVLFANNSAEINNPSDSQFQDFADFMARFPNTDATIEGHTSEVGAASYNLSLSEKRANAVLQLLVETYGVDATRVKAIGYGETRLLDASGSAEAARINRRIEAVVTATEKVKVSK